MAISLRLKDVLPLLAALLLVFFAFSLPPFYEEAEPASAQAESGRVLIIDAGHGGEDGGAVAADGTVESGLNLAIARRVRDLLTFAGVPTTVTREGDAAIYDPGSATLR